MEYGILYNLPQGNQEKVAGRRRGSYIPTGEIGLVAASFEGGDGYCGTSGWAGRDWDYTAKKKPLTGLYS